MMRVLSVFLLIISFYSNIISKDAHYVSVLSHVMSHHHEQSFDHHHEHSHHDSKSKDKQDSNHDSEHKFELSSLLLAFNEVVVTDSVFPFKSYSFIENPFHQISNISFYSFSIFRPPIA